MTKRGRTLLFIAAVIVLVATLLYGSLGVTQAECELCVEFRGQVQCRRGSGATQADARQAAQRAACAVMASGMDESIACGNTAPRQVQCTAP